MQLYHFVNTNNVDRSHHNVSFCLALILVCFFFKQIYLEVKVVPNLVYASKLLAHRKGTDDDDDDDNDNPSQSVSGNQLRPVSDLSADELQALECICLLLCHLTHADEDFLIQFCDAVAILNATSLLQQFLLLGRRKVRVVTDLVAVLSHVLRVLPENAGLIDQIVLGVDTVGKLNFSIQLKEARVIIILCILDFTVYLNSMPYGNSASVIII